MCGAEEHTSGAAITFSTVGAAVGCRLASGPGGSCGAELPVAAEGERCICWSSQEPAANAWSCASPAAAAPERLLTHQQRLKSAAGQMMIRAAVVAMQAQNRGMHACIHAV